MKKKIISLAIALVATVTTFAQQIAVVSSGSTDIYATLADAIAGAAPGSVIYLPGGGFPISDDVKINKKLTIIGIGHNAQKDNADGRTLIAGNLFFEDNSDGSAVMGCYINGNVNIGTAETAVNRMLVKYCNLNSVQVLNANSLEVMVNQNYIRNGSNCSNAKVTFTNNIMHSVCQIRGGIIRDNITTSFSSDGYYDNYVFRICDDCIIEGNIILHTNNDYDARYIHRGSNTQATGNLLMFGSWGDNSEAVGMNGWEGVFVNNAGVTPTSNYHFTEDFQKYEGKYGIYHGTGFSESELPPVPYIKLKNIPDKTDASGKLHISIAVKAGDSE